ncbi:tRNA epoxyqueuosine(34) reductase QueG [Litoribrevibacter euphylliae]|uniref:Epoxyqueuosine reductase n=1 Tax=Litoribrevibacter euphylliae TaxID=1834034 RepID=A0ABV7HDI3_9GAMM
MSRFFTGQMSSDSLQFSISSKELAQQIKDLGAKLGFQDVRITSTDVSQHSERLKSWLDQKLHGEMAWMENHRELRAHPEQLHEGTLRVISVRLDYMQNQHQALEILEDTNKAYVSRYALGRDYHKLMRKRLTQLGKDISELAEHHGFRAFVDSAPVLERGIAENAGMGWIGKNTMLINAKAGSYFFLGELFTNLPLPVDPPQESMHCGSCTSCLDLCPTNAFVAPHILDARKCISYLTIEYDGVIDESLRPLMGNRIYGCDDCQMVCPWNKFTQESDEQDFSPRHQLDDISLLELFQWTEAEFLKNTEGSPIRRAGYEKWQRNIAIALGNAPASTEIIKLLTKQLPAASEMVAAHIQWAIEQQSQKMNRII